MTCRDLNVMVFSGMSTELCHAAVPETAGGVNYRVLSWRGKGTNLIPFFQLLPTYFTELRIWCTMHNWTSAYSKQQA